jgi:protein O-mannosyl-transferase
MKWNDSAMDSNKFYFLNSFFRKHPKAILCLVLCILTISAYWPVKNYPFINYDDGDSVHANSKITSGLSIQNILWAFSLSKTETYWLPLARISHMMDVQLFGVDPHMHHMSNLFFHTLNTLLLFLVFFLMTGELWKCFFLATLFALHPINIESVAWIAERKNLLFTTFWMITMLAYVFYARRPSLSRYLLVLFALFWGLMTKPYIAVLPCALLLMDYWPLKRIKWTDNTNTDNHGISAPNTIFPKASPTKLILEKTPLFLLSYAIIRISMLTLQRNSQVIDTAIRPLLIRIENAVVSYVVYLYKMIWPVDLAIFYPFPDSIPAWKTFGAIIFLIAATFYFLLQSRTRPYLIIGWFWFLGVFLPVIGLVQVGKWSAIADRHAYVPLIGIFMALNWGISELVSKWHYKKEILSISAACVIILLFWGTRTQLAYWSDTYTLFKRALAVTENNYLAYTLVGEELIYKGDYKTSEQYFLSSLSIKPDFPEAKKGLGDLAVQNKDYDKALEYYHQALLLLPFDVETICIIGDLLLKIGKPDEAIDYYSEALAVKPWLPEIYNKRGVAFFKKQAFEQARENFDTAIRLNPKFGEAYYNLGLVALKQGRTNDALTHYKMAILINPDYTDAHKSLADALFSAGDLEQAFHHYSKALQINPNDATTHYNIGVILFQQQQIKAADDHFQKALQIDPSYEKAKIALKMTRNILENEKK